MVNDPTPYSEIAQSPRFRRLMDRKKQFLVPVTAFFFTFYFALPVMTSYFQVLNHHAFGAITWAWIFGFAQFVMTWVLCSVYMRQAAHFDAEVDEIKKEAGGIH